MNNGCNKIIQHDALQKFPLDDSSIDVVMTSPPYWGLRDYGVDGVIGGDPNCKHDWNEYIRDANTWSKPNKNVPSVMQSTVEHQIVKKQHQGYCNKCGAWKGQFGLEPHPQMYIEHIVQVAREVKRVLKKSGSFYLNLGDTYCGGGVGQKDTGVMALPPEGFRKEAFRSFDGKWLQPKQLMMIPVRVAIALQDDGWILRNDIIWHKPNPMPSSVKDRLNNTFEHVFHFVKSRKYFYNLDEIREPHAQSGIERRKYPHASWETKEDTKTSWVQTKDNEGRKIVPLNPLGKNPGDVVEYHGKFKDTFKHYQSVSERKNYQRQVLGVPHDLATSHPNGKNPGDVIKEYQEKRGYKRSGTARLASHEFDTPGMGGVYHPDGKNPGDFWDICTQPFTSYNAELEHFAVFPEELVEKPLKASCPKGGVVLDPFCGRGTVGKVAKRLGLSYVLFDIKPEYCELARLYVSGQKRKLIKYQQKLKWIQT